MTVNFDDDFIRDCLAYDFDLDPQEVNLEDYDEDQIIEAIKTYLREDN